jgi:hypothetical protein
MELSALKPFSDPPPLISQSIALAFIEFGTRHTGLSLSSIFVTPYFTRLGITSLVNALIWLVPYLVLFVATGRRRKFMFKDRHRSKFRCSLVLSLLTGLALVGSLLFVFADSISEWYFESQVATNKSARAYALGLGVTGFVAMQTGLISSGECINELLFQASKDEGNLELWNFRWRVVGRIAGFLLASLDIFEAYTLSLYYVRSMQTVGDNLTFSYVCWIVLHMVLLFVLLPVINSYDYKFRFNDEECSLPSVALVWKAPFRLKALLLSYFFSFGSYILVSIYATSWMTIELFAKAPQGSKFVVHRRDFDLGVSWGACDMLIMSVISLAFSFLYKQKFTYEKFFWSFSNIVSGACLMLSYYFNKDTYTFRLLPCCCFIFTTIFITPNRLSMEFDKKFTKICTYYDQPHTGSSCKGPDEIFHLPPNYLTQWEKLMGWTVEFSKFIALFVIPVVYLVLPNLYDNRWALKTSAVWGIISGFFAFFI